ncbi:hypothetical protein [Actinomyces minihominis]|uniref:hypothetical protein n=1 Tax=Actinomyces minihominis TaxID=2002838 RepID=UPI000C08537C|nr:hypothetical protein [Actinomyces minihominis]
MNLADLRRRFFPSADEVKLSEEELLPLESCDLSPDRRPIAKCPLRQVCTIAGLVTEIKVEQTPAGGTVHLIVEDEDGDELVAVWHGRESIPGATIGSVLELKGTLTRSHDSLRMLEPSYTIIWRQDF